MPDFVDLGEHIVRDIVTAFGIDNPKFAPLAHHGAQIVMDTETRGETLLPVNFLRHLIGMYGDKMQSMVPQYLEASMTAFRKNQQDVRAAFEGALGSNPLAELTRRNMEMFQQAAGAFIPGVGGGKARDAEIAALKAEIADLKAELAKKK